MGNSGQVLYNYFVTSFNKHYCLFIQEKHMVWVKVASENKLSCDVWKENVEIFANQRPKPPSSPPPSPSCFRASKKLIQFQYFTGWNKACSENKAVWLEFLLTAYKSLGWKQND